MRNHSLGPNLKVNFHLQAKGIVSVDIKLNRAGCQWEIFGEEHSILTNQIDQWMQAYCAKTPAKKLLPISLEEITPYTQRTLLLLQTIPFGTFLTYRSLAEKMGDSRSARAVGGACGRNPCLLIIPCHRILASDGSLGGFTAGLEIKKELLRFENILKD